jgi:hypothetical protein
VDRNIDRKGEGARDGKYTLRKRDRLVEIWKKREILGEIHVHIWTRRQMTG